MFSQKKKGFPGRLLFFLAVFFPMQIFFVVLHPIVIVDLDDVLYTVFSRPAIPIPGFWNPSRVFPEVLMPICGNLAGLCTRLGFGSFIHCQVFFFGTALSLFIAGYTAALRRLLEKRFHAPAFISVSLSVLFLMLHFAIFRTKDSANLYLFHSYNACCMFFYTIPALLCCTLVFSFLSEPEADSSAFFGHGLLRNSLLILGIYLAVFSNLYASIVLAVYSGCRALRSLFRNRRKKAPLRDWLRSDWLWLGILLLWFLTLVLEATGGRAGSMLSSGVHFSEQFSSAVRWSFFLIQKFSLLAKLLLTAVPAVCVVFLFFSRSKEHNRQFLSLAGAVALVAILCLAALLLLCAVTDPVYAGRVEAVFPFYCCLLLLPVLCISYLLQRVPKAALLLPIALLFVYTMINTRSLVFADSNVLELDGQMMLRIEDEIYENIRLAAENGAEEVTVQVPLADFGWPYSEWVGDPIAEFLYKYGVIDHRITVHIDQSEEFNERHHIHFESKVLR